MPNIAMIARPSELAGRGLTCGPLCANVAQFPIQPSTQLLRDHTQFLYLRGGDRLLDLLDRATLEVARGQTEPSEQSTHYANAAVWLAAYVEQLETLYTRGDATAEQAELLTEYAGILIAELDE
jgi:hypothetical protein